jgi:hypothetical protein
VFFLFAFGLKREIAAVGKELSMSAPKPEGPPGHLQFDTAV